MSETQEIEKKLEDLKIDEGQSKDVESTDDLPKFDLSMKKKKKPKAVTFADDNLETEAVPKDQAEVDPTAMFSDLKKKKKKKKPVATGDDSNEAKEKESKDDEGENDDEDEIDDETEAKTPDDIEDAEETWLGTDRDYTYQELLGRVFKILRQNNPELAGEKRRYTIVPPQVAREGSKKTVFANIADICKRLNRPLDHVVQFLFTELGTSGSVDGAQRLVIKGRFQQKQMEIIIRRYIVEYVTCKTCKSPETALVKENRLFFLQCESCSSRRSVAAVNSGFQANLVKRAKRKPAV